MDVWLGSKYTSRIDIFWIWMGITKPCTYLHPAPPSTSTQLHPAPSISTQLHPPPSSSFEPAASSLQHPQQYLNQNIARNWAISPNLDQKIKSCPFWLKIGTHGILEVLIPNPDIFGQIWASKFKVVPYVWILVHIVSQGCWFQIQT